MDITKAPISRIILAITGAAPVPVPPPKPVAIKTISYPASNSLISSSLSTAAFLPCSGSAPAPKPKPKKAAPKVTKAPEFEDGDDEDFPF